MHHTIIHTTRQHVQLTPTKNPLRFEKFKCTEFFPNLPLYIDQNLFNMVSVLRVPDALLNK